jgi:DNA-binding PadR family transcriptional regulator
LEKTGLLTGKWEVTSGGRQRRYYHITVKGNGILAERRVQLLDYLSAMSLIIRPVSA